MLLLTLFAGCLALCAAQTTSFNQGISGLTTSTFTQPIQATSVLPTSDSTGNALTILQTTLRSSLELNEKNIDSVVTQLQLIIKGLQPALNFHLTVKNITRV